MKHTLVTILLVAASLHAAEPKDSFPQFDLLSKQEAAATARKQAETDFASGRYRILTYGLTAAIKDDRLAKEGVERKPIAGCIVSDGILEGARVYNEVMREKLKVKLGRDIFDEASKPKSKNETADPHTHHGAHAAPRGGRARATAARRGARDSERAD